MKQIVLFLCLLIYYASAHSQITSPIIKANFGVEADLEANYFNNMVQNGNDDWFDLAPSFYWGKAVIDTTGADSIINRYITDLPFRQIPFSRTMRVPAFSVVNNRIWIDAVFARDHHGDDSTMFAAGSNKNGMSPQNWTCPVSQPVPDKNEILDMMAHVRRAGPNNADSLWFFGGLSIENTVGDRYFDFEMYQTDIYYDRAALKFYGYGPDAGHTSWQFDASGNITVPGDIIFTAHYNSSTLSSIEARIWIDKASLSVTPASFDWNGNFDGAGAGAQYGYAGIIPKTSGAFYVGLENNKSTWAGPFNLILGKNSMVNNYVKGQFMEFGVNLTKLGLDPVSLLGGANCKMPYRRLLVKTRTSTSFTASLKDFVGPFDFFKSSRAQLDADTSKFCGLMGISEISITNPVSPSIYTWSTPDGHISTYPTPTSIIVDSPGTYIVTQILESGCPEYATDTIIITKNPICIILQNSILNFHGKAFNEHILLNWTAVPNEGINYFEIEKSTDGSGFTTIGRVMQHAIGEGQSAYNATDFNNLFEGANLFYRIKVVGLNGQIAYSKIINIGTVASKELIRIMPNPVRNAIRLNFTSRSTGLLQLSIFDHSGRQMISLSREVQMGNNLIEIKDIQNWPHGIYTVKTALGDNVYTQKFVLTK